LKLEVAISAFFQEIARWGEMEPFFWSQLEGNVVELIDVSTARSIVPTTHTIASHDGVLGLETYDKSIELVSSHLDVRLSSRKLHAHVRGIGIVSIVETDSCDGPIVVRSFSWVVVDNLA
jgi:hypothetical protein